VNFFSIRYFFTSNIGNPVAFFIIRITKLINIYSPREMGFRLPEVKSYNWNYFITGHFIKNYLIVCHRYTTLQLFEFRWSDFRWSVSRMCSSMLWLTSADIWWCGSSDGIIGERISFEGHLKWSGTIWKIIYQISQKFFPLLIHYKGFWKNGRHENH